GEPAIDCRSVAGTVEAPVRLMLRNRAARKRELPPSAKRGSSPVPLVPPRMFRALRHRNFRLFFIGQGLSVMGTWLQQVAMGWLTYRISGSVFLLGVVAFCTNAGILFLGTFAGVVADHVHRRNALRVTQS